MGKGTAIFLSRSHLDQRLAKEKNNNLPPPKEGWIASIRKCLVMTPSQLAKRLGMTVQGVAKIEKSDREGTLSLSTLRRVADALICDIKVVLVPRKPLEEILHEQALKTARKIAERSELHMSLEDQGTAASFQSNQIEKIAEELIRSEDSRLWSDT